MYTSSSCCQLNGRLVVQSFSRSVLFLAKKMADPINREEDPEYPISKEERQQQLITENKCEQLARSVVQALQQVVVDLPFQDTVLPIPRLNNNKGPRTFKSFSEWEQPPVLPLPMPKVKDDPKR